MTRYYKQTDNKSCGPIAVMNAIRWAGGKVTRKDLPKFQKACRCSEKGTYPHRLNIVLKKQKHFSCYWLVQPPKVILDMHLRDGGAAIVRNTWREKDGHRGHYFLITKKSKKTYTVFNFDTNVERVITNSKLLKNGWSHCTDRGARLLVWILDKKV